MRRLLLSLVSAVIVASPLMANAAPQAPLPANAPQARVVPVQGWWEQERRHDAFGDRYWQLRPDLRARYDQLEFQIRRAQEQQRHEYREGDRRSFYRLGAEIEQMRSEQYRIMRFWE